MIGVIGLSAVVGLLRGITFELLSLAGWFVAYFAGRWLEPFVAPHLPIGVAGSTLNRGVAFASAFLVGLIVWSLLARSVSALIGATPLRQLDRLLGAAFGLLRGLVVLLAAAWRQSIGAAWLDEALQGLLPLLPFGSALPLRRV